jgi:cytochrome c oxidase subunit 1
MPRRYHEYLPRFALWHQISTVGSQILGFGLLLVLIYLLASLFRGKRAGANPWGGLSLEWQTATPPSTHNFVEQPVVEGGPYDFPEIEEIEGSEEEQDGEEEES